MPVRAVSRHLLYLLARGIVSVCDIPFGAHVHLLRKVQVIVNNIVDRFVVIGRKVAIAIIAIVKAALCACVMGTPAPAWGGLYDRQKANSIFTKPFLLIS
jgi:hypothetical protein